MSKTFSENLTQILGGVYGEEVRLAIHDALVQAFEHRPDEAADSATNGTIDALVSALAYTLGISASKSWDPANNRYIYTMELNGEGGSGSGYTPIDDTKTARDSTWSSSKINSELQKIWQEFDDIEGALGEL